MKQTAVEWLANEFYEKLEVRGDGALNVEKSALSYFWSKAQLEQQRKNHQMPNEDFEEFYNQFNK